MRRMNSSVRGSRGLTGNIRVPSGVPGLALAVAAVCASSCGCPELPAGAFSVTLVDTDGRPLHGEIRLVTREGAVWEVCEVSAPHTSCGDQSGSWSLEAEVADVVRVSGPHVVGTDSCGLVQVDVVLEF
jgi:hypothetical protein